MVNSFLLNLTEMVFPFQVYLSIDWYSKCIYMPVYFLPPSLLSKISSFFVCPVFLFLDQTESA